MVVSGAGTTVRRVSGGDRTHHTPRRSAAGRWCVGATSVALVLAAAACSDDDGAAPADSAVVTSSSAPTTDADGELFVESTESMRSVPTVPASTVAGQTDGAETSDEGVIEVSPTLEPPAPPPVDPDQPATTPAPPTTELVGDPQPSPDTTQPPPPPTVAPPPDPCDRLADFGVEAVVVDAAGTAVATTSDDVSCRYEGNGVVVEVYFVPVQDVRDDWYRRDGIEPVGEVGGDAVGLQGFITPDGPGGDGYTIAIAGGRDGLIVATMAPADARIVGAAVAVLANQAA